MNKSELRHIIKNTLQEKIGFRGPDHADETIDLLKDFASTGDMLNKEINKKQVSADDPLVQKILTILDDNLSINTDFLNAMQMVLDLIAELPDKPEKQKIGFKEEKKKGLDGKACWDGYKLQGTKMKGGKRVDNCVPINEDEVDMHTEDLLEIEVIDESITEAKYKGKTVTLNKPMRGDSKKFKVYVNSGKKNADGSIKVKKVNFGAKGMNIKKNNPKRRKAFRARHNCDNPGPKTMARYWSCKKW
tara:strand:- start:95 stop:832 length:738 start_codon:yes stop_codon:yes gene_type:complete